MYKYFMDKIALFLITIACQILTNIAFANDDFTQDLLLSNEEKAWLEQKKTIRLGVDPEFAPFEFMEASEYKGMASDYVKLLSQRLNINLEVVQGLTWEEVIEKAKQGEIDVLPAVGITEERKKYLNYTPAYMKFHRVIVTRYDTPFISGLSDLKNLSVSVQTNSSHHGFLSENSEIPLTLYPSLQESLLAVSGGHADAFVGNVASSTYWIRKLNLNNLKIAAPVSTEVQGLHFAVRKDWPELASILQKGLATVSPSQQQQISEKWLSLEYSPHINYSLIWKIVAVFSIIIIGVILWNVLLKKQVKKRTLELAYSSNYDRLTDLPNRFLMLDRIKQRIHDASHAQNKIALISIDITDFKKVNDAYGHQSGDALIKKFASQITTLVQHNDSVGRLGGNQFLVISSDFNDASDLVLHIKKLRSGLNKSYFIDEHTLSIATSFGVSIYPDDGRSAEVLMRNADTANHVAKEHVQDDFAFYSESFIEKVSRKLELEHHMQEALKRGEFKVHFQPKVNAQSRQIASFEALLRLDNQELGSVSPLEFIPVAEANGLIHDLGKFVIHESLSALSEWQKQFSPELSMAINLSPIQFQSDRLIPFIEETILKFGLDCKTIEFEITEGILMSENTGIDDKLAKLESLGITLTMDDFGTGYSSMNYLRKYKFDMLKIDREFIMDITTEESSRKLVAASIAMAHELGMKVVAEGVETEAQYNILVEQDCDLLQGWLFSKSLAFDEILALLDFNENKLMKQSL